MRQVFFITDDRMTALLWQGTDLIAKYEFEETEMSRLSQYLESSKDITASIVIDVLEEEITLTTIPHVNPHERKFLIDRVLTRLHRGSVFSTANIIGREKNKRRDDRLLVSGMTSDRLLLKWLDKFNEHDVNIKGIYSLPLIAGNVLRVLKIKKGLTLLVSRQSRNFIRQSIFKDGKLFYSRNIPAAQDLNITMFSADLQKTKKYLENQKLLNTDDKVDVVVLVSDRFFSQLNGLDALLPDMNITYVRHDSLKKKLGIKSDVNIAGQEIFSLLLLGSVTKNHYGRKTDLESYRKKMRDKWVNYLSVASAVILIFVTAVFYIDINVIDQKVEGVEEQLSILKEHNNRLENNLEKLPAKAQQMKVFVNNISDIDRAARQGVDKSLIVISQVFNAYENISLLRLSWSLSEAEYNTRPGIKSVKNARNYNLMSARGGHVIELTANVDFSALSNQDAYRVIDNFLTSIKSLKSVRSVTVTKEAIKASSKDNMNGIISDKGDKKSELSLVLIMEGVDNAS